MTPSTAGMKSPNAIKGHLRPLGIYSFIIDLFPIQGYVSRQNGVGQLRLLGRDPSARNVKTKGSEYQWKLDVQRQMVTYRLTACPQALRRTGKTEMVVVVNFTFHKKMVFCLRPP